MTNQCKKFLDQLLAAVVYGVEQTLTQEGEQLGNDFQKIITAEILGTYILYTGIV